MGVGQFMTGMMKQRIGILFTLALIIICGAGCMSKKEVNEQAIKRFEEKYGENYEILYVRIMKMQSRRFRRRNSLMLRYIHIF